MTRWITGIVLSFVLIGILNYVPPQYIVSLVFVVQALAFWELYSLSQKPFSRFRCGIGLVWIASATYALIFLPHLEFHLILLSGFLISALLFFSGTQPIGERRAEWVQYFFNISYLVVTFPFIGKLFFQAQWQFWIYLMLATTFANDTGAYIAGKKLGKHKLAPQLSPGKTWEGAVGGIIGSFIAAFIVRSLFWPEFSTLALCVIALGVSIIGPVGDLLESFLKRGFDVKDSGTIIPGHGGVLDRLDAVMLTGPWIYFFSTYGMKWFE